MYDSYTDPGHAVQIQYVLCTAVQLTVELLQDVPYRSHAGCRHFTAVQLYPRASSLLL